MKKGFLKLSVLFVALFVGIIGANAAITPVSTSCNFDNPNVDVDSTCDLQFSVTESSTIESGREIEVLFGAPKNILDNKITIKTEDGWTIDGATEKTIDLTDGYVKVTIKYAGSDTITASTVKFAVGQYKKVTAGEACGFAYSFPASACLAKEQDGKTYYFDKDGAATDEETYYKDCHVCSTPDKAPDKKYHGLNGQVTDEAGYNNECTNSCKKEDGKYYCKKGNECTKEEYDNECQPNTKTGSFIPYAGIIAGVALIITATIMVKKQTKLRKI